MSYTGDLNAEFLIVHLVKDAIRSLAEPITLIVKFLGPPGRWIPGEHINTISDEDLIALRHTGKILQSFSQNGKPV